MSFPAPVNTPSATVTATPAAFPARTKQAAALILNIRTDVTALFFADKILITIIQDGRLAHWVHVPLESSDPTLRDRRLHTGEEDGSEFLPLPHLTATTVLGGGVPERDTLGQLFATQIASTIASRTPEEKRLLVVGMGLRDKEMDGETFVQVLELVMACLV